MGTPTHVVTETKTFFSILQNKFRSLNCAQRRPRAATYAVSKSSTY